MSNQNFDDTRNNIERAAESRFPGYKGPRWGEFTPGSDAIDPVRRTQVAFEDGTAYWLDVPAGSIIPGDLVSVLERGIQLIGILSPRRKDDLPKVTVRHTGMTLPGEYFEKKDAIPHKFGTFMQLIRKARD